MARYKENSSAVAPAKKNDFGRFDFLKLSKFCGILQVVMFTAALILIFTKGFNYGIEFAGGTEVQAKFEQKMDSARIRAFAESIGMKDMFVQQFGVENEFLLRVGLVNGKDIKETGIKNEEIKKKIIDGLQTTFVAEGVTIRRVDSVGPQVGAELKRNSVLASFYSLLVLLIYIGLRFQFDYATAAIVCIFHDAIITLGLISLLGKEMNVQIVAAVLTLIGYSVNDTIVNFDRMRENLVVFRDANLGWIINRSVNDCLSRTTLTSLVTFLAVAALYTLAGGVIAEFSFALGFGIIIGTYSSIYVAAPLVLLFRNIRGKPARA